MEKRVYGYFLVRFFFALSFCSLLLISHGCAVSSGSINAMSAEAEKNLLSGLSADGRYKDNKNGTITDTKTSLMWTKVDSYADLGKCLDWNASQSYVSGLNTGGYSDWRLPTVKELKAIYEKSKSNKDTDRATIHIDPIFASGGAGWYWTSELDVALCCNWYVSFFSGIDSVVSRRSSCNPEGVRAVRS